VLDFYRAQLYNAKEEHNGAHEMAAHAARAYS
jgi:hypothetical protein